MPQSVMGAFFAGERRLVLKRFEQSTPGPLDVVIQVKAAGVCGSDLHQYLGRWSQPQYAPGHEIAGLVTDVGASVTHVAPGDRVCVEPFIYCGSCCYCRAGRYFMCPDMGFLSLTHHGGFAQEVIAPAYGVYRLPDTLSLETGALAEPCAVAVHAVRLAQVNPADAVLVLGAGIIGLMAVAAARHFGAQNVYISARHPHQAQAALQLGADGVLSTDPDQLSRELKECLPEGPDVVMEAVGSFAGTFQQAIDLAGKLARVVLVGGNTQPMEGIDLEPVIMKELVLYGSGCYSQIGTRRDFEIAIEMLAADPARFEALVTHRFGLCDIQQAFETALDKKASGALKVMVTDA